IVALSLEELTLFGQKGRALRGKSLNLRRRDLRPSPRAQGPFDRSTRESGALLAAKGRALRSGARRPPGAAPPPGALVPLSCPLRQGPTSAPLRRARKGSRV